MVFTAPLFLFAFLPLVWLAWLLLGRVSADSRISLLVLTAASVVFYAWWDIPNLWVLGGSVTANYLLGLGIASREGLPRRALLWCGVIGNLALLGVFKYYTFVTGARLPLVLPLAISFFTFTQIAFLVDTARAAVGERSFLRYAFFVTFFPHLIAGPIVRLQEIQGKCEGASHA